MKWYIVDFYCHESRLVVEIDGKVHVDEEVKSRDNKRTIDLEGLGVYVIRFTNDEIFNHLSDVLDEIARTASKNLR